MQKFENMDVIAALEAIMHQNTAYYQSDFVYDIKMLREAARSDQPEDKLLLWLSRPSGTFCFRERDVLLKDTQAYNTWKFCGEQTHDRILAYAVELTQIRRISAVFMANDTAPLPTNGGSPSKSSGNAPIQWEVISSSIPMRYLSTNDTTLTL